MGWVVANQTCFIVDPLCQFTGYKSYSGRLDHLEDPHCQVCTVHITNSCVLIVCEFRPTHEVRQDTLRQLAAQTETAKNSVRKARQDGLKHLGKRGEKDLPGMDQVKKLTERYSAELEDAIGQARREIEKAV